MSESGLKAIFLERRKMIERLLRARTGSFDAAEDILQELWLRLEQARPGPVNDPVAYLLRTALNLANDMSLSARRRQDREGAWTAVQPGSAEFPDQEAALAASHELARLQEFMDRMPPHMVRAVEMFRIEGKSQRQIADDLGMSLSGVEKLLARAYRQLAEFRTSDTAGKSASSSVTGASRISRMISGSKNDAQ